MADVLMPTAPVPSDENVAPSNVAPCNPLLAGACDDNDNELFAQAAPSAPNPSITRDSAAVTSLLLQLTCGVPAR